MHLKRISGCRPQAVQGVLVAAILAVLAVFGSADQAGAAAPPGQGDGQAIFQQKCASCHTIGGGKTVGPDLKGISAARERAWLVSFITAPDKVIAQKDPIAVKLLQEYGMPMPAMGLSEAEVSSVIEYLSTQGGGAPASGPAPAAAGSPATQNPLPAAIAGDLTEGTALFSGARSFQNGGAPCMSCHSAAGAGILGGGALGPELTGAYQKLGGDSGISPVLASLPFPTMKPIYDSRPLTPQEQADLKAFLLASSALQPVETTWLMTGLVLAGLVVLLGIAQLVWRKRVTSIRKALVDRA